MPNWFSFCVLKTESSVDWMLAADMLGSKMSTFGPKFGVFDWVQPVTTPLTVHTKAAVPVAPVPSLTVTVAL